MGIRRGRFGAKRMSAAMPRQSTRKLPIATALSMSAGTPGTPHSVMAYQIEPQSMPRVLLKS